MTPSRILRPAILGSLTASLLWAGAFWDSAPPESWTEAQVEQLLLNSPWAKEAEVDFLGSAPSGVGFPGGQRRSPGRLPSPFPGGGGGWLQASSYTNHAFDPDVTVRWESALPIRHALDLADSGLNDGSYAERYYVVTLTSLPLGAAPSADDPEQLRRSVALLRKGRPQIRAERVEILPQPGAPGVCVYFSREKRITLDDKTVELVLHLGDYQVSRKFKLKDMVYRGSLEL